MERFCPRSLFLTIGTLVTTMSAMAQEAVTPTGESFETYTDTTDWDGGRNWTGFTKGVAIGRQYGLKGRGLGFLGIEDDTIAWWNKGASSPANIVVSWHRADGPMGLIQAREYFSGMALAGIDFRGREIARLYGDGSGANKKEVLAPHYELGRWYRFARQYNFVSNQYRVRVDDAAWSEWRNFFNDRKAPCTTKSLLQVRGCKASTGNWLVTDALPKYEPPPVSAPANRLLKGPYLLNVTKSSIVIMWETKLPTTSSVEHRGDAKTWERTTVGGLRRIHEVKLTGLAAQSSYRYRVCWETADGKGLTPASPEYTFTTAVRGRSPFSFAVYGDTRWNHGPSRHGSVARAVLRSKPGFVVNTGDIVMGKRGYEEYGPEFFGPAAELLASVPYYVAIGDHEGRFVGRKWFDRLFSYSKKETYYSFDYGNGHFVVLDPSIAADGGPGIHPGTEQYEWLVDDLSESKAEWRFVFLHYPVYTTVDRGSSRMRATEMRKTVAPLFEQYGIDVVFNGHVHYYERTKPVYQGAVDAEKGVIYVTTGGGGASLERVGKRAAADVLSEKSFSAHHFCLVRIQDKKLDMCVYGIKDEQLDRLVLEK